MNTTGSMPWTSMSWRSRSSAPCAVKPRNESTRSAECSTKAKEASWPSKAAAPVTSTILTEKVSALAAT